MRATAAAAQEINSIELYFILKWELIIALFPYLLSLLIRIISALFLFTRILKQIIWASKKIFFFK